MSATEHLAVYAEGWTAGDVDTILEALAEGFVYDDPNAGRIARACAGDSSLPGFVGIPIDRRLCHLRSMPQRRAQRRRY